MKAPFPYFGGKTQVVVDVWQALGDVKMYIEPFFGSGAVLLNRPPTQHTKLYETINDKDGFIANVWRALQADPDAVAKVCDWPCNHADLSARKKHLIKNEEYLLKNLIDDPKFYDMELAGYWIWAASHWIGSGLTRTGSIPHLTCDIGIGQRPQLTHDMGIGKSRANQTKTAMCKTHTQTIYGRGFANYRSGSAMSRLFAAIGHGSAEVIGKPKINRAGCSSTRLMV